MFYKFRNISRLALTIFLASFLQIAGANAQTNSFWRNNWVVGISPGTASYFGDLSQYDYDPVNKIIHESGPAISFIAGKKLNNLLQFGLVTSLGKVSGQRTADWGIKFLNRFNEFGVYSEVSVSNIIKPFRKTRFDFGLMANYSIIYWRSVSYKISDKGVVFSHGLDKDGNKSGKGQASNHFGVGYYIDYSLNSRFSLRLSQTMQFLNTDHFDSFSGSTNVNDYFLRSGIGLIFNINPDWSPKNGFEDCPTF